MKIDSHRMNLWFSVALALVVCSARVNRIHARQSGAAARSIYQQALHEEEGTGNLKSAIALYERVLSARPDRALAAQALIRMAECHQKLGNSESRKIYERVLRDYSDQKEAVAMARAQLSDGAPKGAGTAARRVWMGAKVDVYGAVSPDGRLLTFYDGDNGNLAVHDLATGADRSLTSKQNWSNPSQYGQNSAFAPDGQRVAYSWYNERSEAELRVVDVAASAHPMERVVYANAELEWIAPYDWSRDGKWIAVQVYRKDRTAQIGLVAADSGSLRILKSIDWRGSFKLTFSPDSRYLAFDIPANEAAQQRDVLVLAVDGSSETAAVVNPADDQVIGWSVDGDNLLFMSDRTGKMGVYAAPFHAGRAQGSSKLLISDIGQAHVIGFSRSGSFYYGIGNGSRLFYTASIDFDSGKVLTPAAPAADRFLGTNYQPDWSSDGEYLSYLSYGGRARGALHLVIRSARTGQTRELWPNLSNFGFPRWSADGRSLIANGYDLKGRQGLYRIDAQTGNTESIVVSASGEFSINPSASPDGQKIYYLRGANNSRVSPKTLVEHDLSSSTERDILRDRCSEGLSFSPHGPAIACASFDPVAKRTSILMVPIAGGSPRELVGFMTNGADLDAIGWTSDGRSIFFTRRGELWVASASGGPPRKIDLGGSPVLDVRIHPDGQQIAFTKREKRNDEVWMLENILPAVKAQK